MRWSSLLLAGAVSLVSMMALGWLFARGPSDIAHVIVSSHHGVRHVA